MKRLNLTGLLLLCVMGLQGCLLDADSVGGVSGGGGAIVLGGSGGTSAPPASQPMAPPIDMMQPEPESQDPYDEPPADVVHPPGQEAETPSAVIERGEWTEDARIGEWRAKEDRCNLRARKLSRKHNLNIRVLRVEVMGFDEWGNKVIRCHFKKEPTSEQLQLFDNSHSRQGSSVPGA